MRIGVVLTLALWLGAAVDASEARRITVVGEGRVTVQPDMATITVGVTQQAGTAEAAMTAVNMAMKEVFSRLDISGIAPRDVQTSGLALNGVYEHRSNDSGGRRLVGFSAANRISVRVRDIDTVGAVLGDLVEAGVTDIRGIRFGLRDPRASRDEARRQAVADARDRAMLFAAAAGVELGPVVSIEELAGAYPQPEMMRAAAMSDAVPIAAGELSLSAQVQVVWNLVD